MKSLDVEMDNSSETALVKLEKDDFAPVASPVTPAQAKIDAIASLTMSAYAKASTLALTDEEIQALRADFPDEAFQPGAAGKEHLIYIEHAYLRDRLNQVFRPGQWSIIPRNRWAEEFQTTKGEMASRVYVEAMLMVRGCFVAEAVGAMVYYPNNPGQDYGDAVEGGKTAALRRCAKELGIGLQAWKKEFCEAWWARRRQGVSGQRTPQKNAPTARAEAKKTNVEDVLPRKATEETKKWFLEQIKDIAQVALGYAWDQSILLPNEGLLDWPLEKVPTSKGALHYLLKSIAEWDKGRNQVPGAEVPEPTKAKPTDNEWWRAFPIPFGKSAGTKLGELDTPTIFGFWANFLPSTTWEDKDGTKHDKTPMKIEMENKFRDALDAAGEWYRFKEKNA